MLRPPKSKDDLRQWCEEATRLINSGSQISGGNGIQISKGIGGVTVSASQPTQIGIIKRARLNASAGSYNYITANLIDETGNEITSGYGYNITVYCSIMGGTALNAASPRLVDDGYIFVVQLPYDNTGTLQYNWYCTTIFQATQDCT